jgi:secreted trypsin-like serine protease
LLISPGNKSNLITGFPISWNFSVKMKIFVALALLSSAVFALPGFVKDPKIVGGENAVEGAAPYMVSVQVFRESIAGYRHTCGGSIMSPAWILTAAHCITENEPLLAPLRIVAGEHNFAVTTQREQIRLTPTVHIHAEYTGGVAPYDIALLGVAEPLNFISGVVGKINLPSPGSLPQGFVQLFGWGSISTNEVAIIPDILQTVQKDILPLELCREILDGQFPMGTPLHFTNVCTGPLASEITACSGDSGGAIVQGTGDDVSFL